MSRIGKTPIIMPANTTIKIINNQVVVTGPKGELTLNLPHGITIDVKSDQINVVNNINASYGRALHGLIRTLIANNIKGVNEEWSQTLELTGVGYRANVQGSDLILNLGFSHDVVIHPITGISFAVKEGRIIVSGIDKQKVGKITSDIRKLKPPEPYKGKGIHYLGEKIRRKAGKAAKAVGGAK
jgi:large subunit ribosomal protein L6